MTKGGGGSRGWTETVWNGTGSGCAKKSAKPSWQTDTGCANRTIGDISYDADPGTGVAVYDTYGGGGWSGLRRDERFVAGDRRDVRGSRQCRFDSKCELDLESGQPRRERINDVTKGSNGSCKVAYLCNAETGYDGPTGWGTPNGLSGL